MIPYEQLAAALERRAVNQAAPAEAPAEASPASLEDNTLSGGPAADHNEYEVGDILADDEAS